MSAIVLNRFPSPAMKNLPGYILLASLASLVLLTIASCLGYDFHYLPTAAHIVGITCGAGVVAIFLGDYASHPAAPAERTDETEPVSRPVTRAPSRHHPASIGLHRDPATVSL